MLAAFLTLALPLLAQTASTQAVAASSVTGPGLILLSADQYPGFEDSFKGKGNLLKASANTLKYLEKLHKAEPTKTFKIGGRAYGAAHLIDSVKALVDIIKTAESNIEIDRRVRETFDVFQSVGLDGQGKVVFSSYYQPVLQASLKKTDGYTVPLYKRPADMVDVDLSAFGKNGDTLVGRVTKDKRVVPYFSRGEIDIKKALAGKGHEVAWLKDKFDALDLHIQGSGILKLPSGKEVLARYAATNARPYNSVGLTLVKAGVFSREEITHDKLRQYLKDNPQAESWILSSNPRYTFFEIVPLPGDGEPFGTVQESLSPSRSIAVDPAFIPLGTIAFFTTTSPQADEQGRLIGHFPNSRFALCMDTGGAIKSPGRVDIYVGHGKQAAITARNQWADGKLYILVKKVPPRER